MTGRRALGLIACLPVLLGAGPPGFDPAGLTRLATVRGVAAISGHRFRLADGRHGRLAGIAAPRLAPPGARWQSAPLAGRARAALRGILDGAPVELWIQPRRTDRYGDLVAHLRTAAGVWVQGRLLALGLAMVRTRPDDRALARPMLAIEARARAARRGLWALPRYRVRSDREVATGRFQIVEGRVFAVAERRRFAYLNFARDWRRDFTIRLDRKARRLFARAGIDLSSFARRRVRVRGWVEERNGPMIAVSHPEQIELLGPPMRPARRR